MNPPDEISLLAAPSSHNLRLRKAELHDIPPLWVMIEDYKHLFFDDYDELDQGWIKELVLFEQLIIIEGDAYPVGVVWFSDRVADLHATIHLLIRPQYLRQAVQQKLFFDILDKAFYSLNIKKIKAFAMEHQKGAIRLLKICKFKQNGLFRNDTRFRGKLTDIFAFELHRKFWEKFKRGII
jgi:RimJ/RimL family protein N-acetyltransferase